MSVVLLSTLHNSESEVDNKPEIVTYYNQSKSGFDLADQVIRYYSCKRGTRRWPLTFFYNCIDIAGFNSYIIYCTKFPEYLESEKKNARRNFLYKTSTALMKYGDIDAVSKIEDISKENSFNNDRKRCSKCPQRPGVKTSMKCYSCNAAACKEHCAVICRECLSTKL